MRRRYICQAALALLAILIAVISTHRSQALDLLGAERMTEGEQISVSGELYRKEVSEET